MSIYPCLWFDNNAREAAGFYTGIFEEAAILADTPMVVTLRILGKKFMLLNGGPAYKINPSVSFFVVCRSEAEINEKWARLTEGGTVMMPLNKYPWSERYGWCMDRYGVNWQLMTGGTMGDAAIVPALMFTMGNSGKAEEAINFYTSLFPHSSIKALHRYEPGEYDVVGHIKHGQFYLDGQLFVAMDSSGPHPFTFNEGVSFVVECDTQEQIDHYWDRFTREGAESRCGWCRDKYGVSWQVIPAALGTWMNDPERTPRVVPVLMGMNKLDMAALQQAYDGI